MPMEQLSGSQGQDDFFLRLEYKMSFVGFSISQAEQISGADQRLSSVESLASSKVAQSAYDAKLALVDAKDANQDSRLTAVESLASSKVAQSVYDAKMSLLDSNDAAHASRLDAVEALAGTKVAQSAYDAKVALLDAKDAEQDGRLSAVESRATAIESDIGTRIQSEINAKVAQATFDALATELRDADSALTTALATKVAATTQAAVDATQNEVIATKASITGVNNALNNLTNSFNAEIERLDGVDATKVAQSAYQAKIDALEEFIGIFLQTYTINKPNNQAYEYTGVKQNLLAVAFQTENPSNVVYDSVADTIAFDLPNTVGQLDFVDLNIGGTWYHVIRSSLTIAGTRVTIPLSVPAAGEVLIFTRYDAYSGNSNAGFYSLMV